MAEEYMKIGEYNFKIPEWWDTVTVDVPDDLTTAMKVRFYLNNNKYRECGTKKNWKTVLKFWAIGYQRSKELPVFIAHCYETGGEYETAVNVLKELFEIIGKYYTDKEYEDIRFDETYIPYTIGGIYLYKLKDRENAKVWYTKALKHLNAKDTNFPYDGIIYYAKEAKRELEYL